MPFPPRLCSRLFLSPESRQVPFTCESRRIPRSSSSSVRLARLPTPVVCLPRLHTPAGCLPRFHTLAVCLSSPIPQSSSVFIGSGVKHIEQLLVTRIWTCQCQSILSINARDTRATVLEQILRKLGVEKLTKVDVQRLQWEVLEAKIGNWIHFMQISFEIVFGSKAYMEMKESVFNLAIQLAQTAQETFIDFEEALERDATKSVVLDGSVHPLTSYVINYVKFLFDYQSTVKELFQELELDDPQGQLADVTTRIMQALQNNLDGKSKIYRDPALTQLFLMNNIHYIVRSVYGRPMHKFVREGFTVRVCVVRGELDNGKDTLNVHMGKGVHRLIRVTFPNARSYGGKQAAPSKEWKQVSQPSVDTNGTEVAAESSKPPAGEDDSPVPDINSSAGRGDGSVPKASSEAEGAPSQVAAPETSPEVEGSACHSPISGVSGSVIHACSG
ncbi:Exocyst complex component EXO70A1 [Linum perenne]